MTHDEIQSLIKDLKGSLWKIATLVITILIFIGGTINGLTILYITSNSKSIERLQDDVAEIRTATVKNDSYIRSLERDTDGIKENLVRLDERLTNSLNRIEKKLDDMSN